MLWSLLLHAGGGAGSIHLANVLMHAVNGALIFVLCRSFGLDALESGVAGLLFIVWPTQVEAVAWLSAMSDVMVTTFVLAIVVVFIRSAAPFGLGRLLLLSALTVLALFTKETALAIAPILALVAIWRWSYRPDARWQAAPLAIAFSLCSAFLVWRVWFRFALRDAIQPVLTRYVLKEQISRTFGGLAVPLAVTASSWMVLLFGGVALLLPISAALLARRRQPAHVLACIGALWAVLATAPAVGYLFIGNELEGSRYLYLAMVGWTLLLASAWSAAATKRPLTRIVGGAAMALLAVLSIQQSRRLVWNWRGAAVERETILMKARSAAAARDCTRVRATNLPDTYHGAQLFRNGFEEAFAPSARDGTGTQTCDLHWDGSDFR